MSKEVNQMNKFNFLLGDWNMKYIVPKSQFSGEDSGKGKGVFKRIYNNHYISFDYSAKLSSGKTAAHGIFAWDEKSNFYRYWWFEHSGAFMEATCNFLNDTTLCLNWHNSLLVQTFTLGKNGQVTLQMKNPSLQNEYDIILEVIFTKKK